MSNPVFFWSWPIWARLSFVLGGLLIVVLCLAGLVKVRKSFKVRKLTDAQAVDVERLQIRTRLRSSDEIPFGAKAMLEDPEIEGVWNSRASTPLQSPVLGPRRPSLSRRSLSLFSRSRRNSSVSSITDERSPQNDCSPSDRQPGLEGSPANSPESPITTCTVLATSREESRVIAEQCSAPKVHNQTSSIPRRRSVTTRIITNQWPSQHQNIYVQEELPPRADCRRQRSRVATDPSPNTCTNGHRGRTLILDGPATSPHFPERTLTTRKALDRMEAHRRFHAAESGQLQPRAHLPETKHPRHRHSASENLMFEHENNRAVSWPITTGEILVDCNAPQKIERRMSPNVVPFRAFVEMHPPPKEVSKAPPSAWTSKTQGLMEEKLQTQQPKKRVIIKNRSADNGTKEVYVVSNKHRSNQNGEQLSMLGTQLRRVNKGFEVLPAGALNEEPIVKDFGLPKQPLQKTSNDITKPRKLQKRSRSTSEDSRISVDSASGLRP